MITHTHTHTHAFAEHAMSACYYGCKIYRCGCGAEIIEHLAAYGCQRRTEPVQAAPTVRRWMPARLVRALARAGAR